MTQERRGTPRLRVNLKTYIEDGSGRRSAVILNISTKGCFVLTPQAFAVGDTIKVEVGKPGVMHMTLEGAVVRQAVGRGVGVRFKNMTATQQALLSKLLQRIAGHT